MSVKSSIPFSEASRLTRDAVFSSSKIGLNEISSIEIWSVWSFAKSKMSLTKDKRTSELNFNCLTYSVCSVLSFVSERRSKVPIIV